MCHCGVSLIHVGIDVQLKSVTHVPRNVGNYLHTTNGESSFYLAHLFYKNNYLLYKYKYININIYIYIYFFVTYLLYKY